MDIQIKSIKLLLFLGSSFLLVYGCHSQVPHPMSYPLTAQNKMQAANHWNLLAEDVASQVKIAAESERFLDGKAIYVQPDTATAFGKLFSQFLVTHLLQQGFQIVESQSNALVLHSEATVVQHTDRTVRRTLPFLFTGIGMGIAVARNISNAAVTGLAAGAIADELEGLRTSGIPNKEVVIATRISVDSRLIFHQTDIYYINNADAWQYDLHPYGKKIQKGKIYKNVSQ